MISAAFTSPGTFSTRFASNGWVWFGIQINAPSTNSKSWTSEYDHGASGSASRDWSCCVESILDFCFTLLLSFVGTGIVSLGGREASGLSVSPIFNDCMYSLTLFRTLSATCIFMSSSRSTSLVFSSEGISIVLPARAIAETLFSLVELWAFQVACSILFALTRFSERYCEPHLVREDFPRSSLPALIGHVVGNSFAWMEKSGFSENLRRFKPKTKSFKKHFLGENLSANCSNSSNILDQLSNPCHLISSCSFQIVAKGHDFTLHCWVVVILICESEVSLHKLEPNKRPGQFSTRKFQKFPLTKRAKRKKQLTFSSNS